MMKYRCLAKEKYNIGEYYLFPIRKQDIFKIKKWRNDQMVILRQSRLLTDEEQINYFNESVYPLFSQPKPMQILFSYLKGEECIGYGGLTNVDWLSERAELSFLLDTMRSKDNKLYVEEFKIYLTLLKRMAFSDLRFNRLFTETYDIRPYHIAVLEECGFKLEGCLRQHVLVQGKFVDSLIHGCLREDRG